MNTITSPSIIDFQGDASLRAVLSALEQHADKSLALEYCGRTIQQGYHFTEVKAGSFVTLDCGGNPDQWRETILQVEDLPSQDGRDFMTVEKFRSILDQVATKVELDRDARLTFEVSPANAPMQVFDAQALEIDTGRVRLLLASRPAICKPRHRAEQVAAMASCYGNAANGAGCCA